MSNEPGAPGEYPPGQQGWTGGPQQQPPYPGGYGQQQQPPPGWGGYPQQPGQPGYGQQPTGPVGPQGQAKGALGALFDFEFTTFATPAVVKILYIVGMVLLGLAYVGVVISTFFSQGVGVGIVALIGGAIAVLFYLILFRVTLEFYYAVVRMSEDIHRRG